MLRRGQGRDELGSVRFRDDELARVDALVQAVDGEEVAAVARLALVVPRLHAAGALRSCAARCDCWRARDARARRAPRRSTRGRLGPRRATRGGRRQTHRQTRGAQGDGTRATCAPPHGRRSRSSPRGCPRGRPRPRRRDRRSGCTPRANHVRRRRGRRLHASRLLLVPAAHRRGLPARAPRLDARGHPRDTTADLARRAR